MSTLMENPYYGLAIGGLAVLILAGIFYHTGLVKYLVWAGVAAILTLGYGVLESAIVTDHEQVEQALYDGAAAVQTNDPDRAATMFAPQADPSVQRLLSVMRQFQFESIHLLDYQIELSPIAQPELARVRLAVFARLKEGLSGKGIVKLLFVKTAGAWKLQEFAEVSRGE
ncbi:MAG: hypothetical protein SFX18_19880 [Pirellulales bacterium]|nr:hypothetical protein [Pirellulales bacterium]